MVCLHYSVTFLQRSSSSVFLQKCRFLLISAHHLQSTGRVRIQAVLSTSAFLAGFCYFTGFILQHSSTCTHSEGIWPHVIAGRSLICLSCVANAYIFVYVYMYGRTACNLSCWFPDENRVETTGRVPQMSMFAQQFTCIRIQLVAVSLRLEALS